MSAMEIVVVPQRLEDALELVVNFGVVTGRRATRAEVERLAGDLLERVPAATVAVVERYELAGTGIVACVDEVRLGLSAEAATASGYEFDVLQELVAGVARTWALGCRELPPEGDLTLAERLAPTLVELDG